VCLDRKGERSEHCEISPHYARRNDQGSDALGERGGIAPEQADLLAAIGLAPMAHRLFIAFDQILKH